MANNAYNRHRDEDDTANAERWIDLEDGWHLGEKFGWAEQGLRGYVFHDPSEQLIVISFKGTSGSIFNGPTFYSDKYNDNMMFSCCARDEGWHSECSIKNQPKKQPTADYFRSLKPTLNMCDFNCMNKQIEDDRDLYLHLAIDIFYTVQRMYPQSKIWLTGHSLGGGIASLVGAYTFSPAVTFEAPGARIMAERSKIFPSRHLPPSGISKDKWGALLDNAMSKLPIYHFGNDGDPVFVGKCNGIGSSCRFAGYSMESKCHLGRTCTYGRDQLGLNIRHHSLSFLINRYLKNEAEFPDCELEKECADCESWMYV